MTASANLRSAAGMAISERRSALAELLLHESAMAAEAEHLAAVAADTVMSNIAPSYRPATRHALALAREVWPDLAAAWDRPPL